MCAGDWHATAWLVTGLFALTTFGSYNGRLRPSRSVGGINCCKRDAALIRDTCSKHLTILTFHLAELMELQFSIKFCKNAIIQTSLPVRVHAHRVTTVLLQCVDFFVLWKFVDFKNCLVCLQRSIEACVKRGTVQIEAAVFLLSTYFDFNLSDREFARQTPGNLYM